MARNALPIEATRAAVKQLTDSGVKFATITVRDVREITGTGSFSTINDHLGAIRLEWIEAVPEGKVDLAELDPLIDAIQAIVNRKLSKAEARHENERIVDRQHLAKLSDDLALAAGENGALSAQLEEMQAENARLRDGIANAHNREAKLRGELEATRGLYAALLPLLGRESPGAQEHSGSHGTDAAGMLAAGLLNRPSSAKSGEANK